MTTNVIKGGFRPKSLGLYRPTIHVMIFLTVFENPKERDFTFSCFASHIFSNCAVQAMCQLKSQYSCLRNRFLVGGGCVYVLQSVFVPTAKNETTVLGNGWTDFHETYTKR